jgi:hypothetical protein
MSGLVSPLHVGRLNGRPLRFFRAPLTGTHLPWHAFDDMQACLALPESLRAALKRDLMADWGRDVRTVATADGIVTIAPHWMAAGLIGAVAGRTGDDLDLTVAYQQALFSAWAELTGDMPAADSLALLQAALCNMFADQGRAGSSGGSAA